MDASRQQQLLRQIPAVHKLLLAPGGQQLTADFSHDLAAAALAAAAARLREQVLAGTPVDADDFTPAALGRQAARWLASLTHPGPRRVLNATGVVLHTNLGRAPLPPAVMAAASQQVTGYADLEFDLATGRRGSRQAHIEPLLQFLTGAEAAMVVNNNAAAVLLALAALARGRQAIAARGELVEIGGSFRLPTVMTESGCQLVAVGTTNKTYPRDYEEAITDATALLLKVHPSNYQVVGFTAAATVTDLAAIGRARHIPVMVDAGSGVLLDLTAYGLPPEPTVAATVAAGADIVTFSGDKLLGGPQAGILVGRRPLIERCRRHPLARALRIDKLSLAALTGVLALYLRPAAALRDIPTLTMLTLTAGELDRRSRGLAAALAQRLGPGVHVEVITGTSLAGGGALPATELPTTLVSLQSTALAAAQWHRRLRQGQPPVITRLQDDALLLDPRTILPADADLLVQAIVDGHS